MERTPDFITIGAMKCATTTLHEQLARQPGVVMSRPKEPNFFSDDDVYARGMGWYTGLFAAAGPEDLCGESSTHYTKLPTYPKSVERMVAALPSVKLIYVMRHPIDRLFSQFVHERTVGRVSPELSVGEAIEACPELVAYGRYAEQLAPYLETYGRERVLPVFFGRLARFPQEEFSRIGAFLGRPDQFVWDASMEPQNVGDKRLRLGRVRHALVHSRVLSPIRQRLVSRSWSERLKRAWRTDVERPELTSDLESRLRQIYDEDLARLGAWLGVSLDCESFDRVTGSEPREWRTTRSGTDPR
ncbi:MAG: sulfotransferase [Isosphaeraceae bacterium]